MHFQSNRNPERKFYGLDELKAAQDAATATGDLCQMTEVFDLTWVDDTSTTSIPDSSDA